MSGQTLNDRLTAAKHTLAGQGLARIVCKATTEEVIGPKKKHIDHLLHCTNEPNVSIPQLANLLIERTQHSSWVVVFKSLITVHHVMCYGNDRFTQYLASSNCTFQLGSFIDKCGVQGYDMSTFIRRYAKYLNEKAIAYRTVAFDFCKCKRGKEDGTLRTMNIEKLLKTLPSLQNQLDALLEFDCSSNDLSNGVVNSCFMLLFRDLIRLFACYNDGIINLLEKYFEMNKKHARDSLDIYKKFLIRMDRVAEFLKVAENVGIDKGEIPDLTKAPSSLLQALESHLAALEGRKNSASAASTDASGAENATFSQELKDDMDFEAFDGNVAVAAEVIKQMKDQPWKDVVVSPQSGSSKTNPFLASPSELCSAHEISNQGILDLFTEQQMTKVEENNPESNSYQLVNNPFADCTFGEIAEERTIPAVENHDAFQTKVSGFSATNEQSISFVSAECFAAAFADTAMSGEETATVKSPTRNENEKTTKLSLPVLETFGGRSTSPSPTVDLMRGAGTTPILANIPDGTFGDIAEPSEDISANTLNPETSDFAWVANRQPSANLTGIPDPFAVPLEVKSTSASTSPVKVVSPVAFQAPSEDAVPKNDLFGLDSNDYVNFGQPSLSQPCAPPPSPFGGIDFQTFHSARPDLQSQFTTSTSDTYHPGELSPQQPMFHPGSEKLNFSSQPSVQFPTSVSPTSYFSSHGMTDITGCGLSQILPEPKSTGPASFNKLGKIGDISSVHAYLPSSGLSSPAKTSAIGGLTAGECDVFGELLQPHSAPKTTPVEHCSSSFLKGDLDSTLANLASNLDIIGPKQPLKKVTAHQWGSPKQPSKTGCPQPAFTGGNVKGTMSSNNTWSSPQLGYPLHDKAGHFGTTSVSVRMSKPLGATNLGQDVFSDVRSQIAAGAPPQNAGLQSQVAPSNDPFGAL